MKKQIHGKLFYKLLVWGMIVGLLISGCGDPNQGDNSYSDASDDQVWEGVQIVEPENKIIYSAAFQDMKIPVSSYGFQIEGQTLYAMIRDFGAKESHYYKEVMAGASALELMTSSAVYEDLLKLSLDFSVDGEGYLYFFLSEEDAEFPDRQSYYLSKCASGGRELMRTEITEQLMKAYEEGESYQTLLVDDSGKIYIATLTHIYLYDENGDYQGELKDERGMEAIGKGKDGNIYYTRKSVRMESNAGLELVEVDFENHGIANIYHGFPEGVPGINLVSGIQHDFLINDGEYLYGYQMNNQKTERILKWSDVDVYGQSIVLVCEQENEEILAVEKDSTVRLIYLTEKNESEELSDSEIITIGMTHQQGNGTTLQNAVIQFNRMQDRYKIELKTYGEKMVHDSLGGESRDGMEAMTLELVAGKGPDLILQNGNFPIYAKRGLLEDLTPYLEKSEVLSREDYLESALQLYTFADKLVALPSYLSLGTCWGYTDQIGEDEGRGLEEFLKLQEKYPDIPLFDIEYPSSGIVFLINVPYSFIDWDNGTCDFHSERFRDFLEYCSGFHEIEDRDGDPWTPLVPGEDYLITDSHFWGWSTMGRIKMAAGQRAITFIGYPTEAGSGNYIYGGASAYNIGISAQSKHKEGAWAFLEYLHSTVLDADYAYGGNGFPAKIKYLEQSMNAAVGEKYTNRDSEYVMTKEDVDRILDLITNAKPASEYSHSTIVLEIIDEETGAYFAGDKSVEEVMDIIQRRIQLYLSENY